MNFKNMGHYEDIKIDRSEGWKYKSTLDNCSDGYRARVYVDNNGEISKDSYSKEFNKKNDKTEKTEKKEKKDRKEKEGCLTKLWKAPFRLLWWLTKKVLIILSLGLLSSVLSSDD